MAQTIQVRRGTKAQLDGITLAAGELGHTTDTLEVYVGTDAANILVGRCEVGLLSARPSAGVSGRFYYATDNGNLYIDDGSSWQTIGGGGGGLTWSKITGNTTAADGNGYLIVASGDVDLTLPATPSEGDTVGVCDAAGMATTHTITVLRNGENIRGTADDLVIDVDDSGFVLVYTDSTEGWVITTEIGAPTAQTTGFNWGSEEEVTTNQSPTTSDLNSRYLYTTSTAADRTLTLPSVGSGEDGKWLTVTNASKYTITIAASDSDTIDWPALYVTSIEMLPNTHIVLRYNHANTKWEIVDKQGSGQVRPSGTVLYLPFDSRSATASAGYFSYDGAENRHSFWCNGIFNPGNQKFGRAAAEFNAGNSDYAYTVDSADWDVFGSTSNDCTVCGWVRFDTAASSEEEIIAHREDGNNTWFGYRNAAGAAKMQVVSGGGTIINLSGGTLSQNTWHHYAVCRVGAEVGLYVDGSQVAYLATFTPDTFTGSLYFAQNGGSTNYFDGRLQDWTICYQNIFNAAPNSTPDDSITIDTLNPLGLVI